MGEVSTIGLDIAKSVFQIHGVDVDGAVVIRKRVSRAKVLEFFAALPRCGSLWHFADKQTAPGFVAYWGNNGHRLALASNGSVVNDRLRPPQNGHRRRRKGPLVQIRFPSLSKCGFEIEDAL